MLNCESIFFSCRIEKLAAKENRPRFPDEDKQELALLRRVHPHLEADRGIATFEFTGTESSARVEDERVVIELSPRFQFADATRGAPFILHELVHLGSGTWPGTPVDAAQELLATEVTDRACQRLALGEDRPLGCIDAADLLADDDPLQAMVEAGYPPG